MLLGHGRTAPVSAHWGFDRGTPVDRYFIERFLESRRSHVTGRVLEIGDARYTRRFGHEIVRSDVLDVDPANPRATLVGSLEAPDQLPVEAYDCFILTQTLQYLFDPAAGVAAAARLLVPGGSILASVPAVGRIDATVGAERDFWRFTAASATRLFSPHFAELEVTTAGNVLAACAFLYGLASEELTERELTADDALYPVVVMVHGRKRS